MGLGRRGRVLVGLVELVHLGCEGELFSSVVWSSVVLC